MEKYFKMSDFVVGDVSMSMNHNGDVSVQYDYADPDMIVRKTMDAMEHAINSHDELVEQVLRLTEFCESFSKFCEDVSEFMNHPNDENSYWKSYHDYKNAKAAQ